MLKSIRQLLAEAALAVERTYFGDVVSQLIDNPKLIDDFTWLESSNLEPIGVGASRGAYRVPDNDDIVIKKAIVPRGKIDNQREIQKFKTFPNLFPKTYVHAPDFDWIVMEKVEVVSKDAEQLKKILSQHMPVVYNTIINKMTQSGIDPTNPEMIKQSYYDLIFNLEARKHGLKTVAKDQTKDRLSFQKAFKRMVELVKGQKVNILFEDADILKMITRDRKFFDIYKAASEFGIAFKELRGDNLGIDTDGNLVIIDLSIMEY